MFRVLKYAIARRIAYVLVGLAFGFVAHVSDVLAQSIPSTGVVSWAFAQRASSTNQKQCVLAPGPLPSGSVHSCSGNVGTGYGSCDGVAYSYCANSGVFGSGVSRYYFPVGYLCQSHTTSSGDGTCTVDEGYTGVYVDGNWVVVPTGDESEQCGPNEVYNSETNSCVALSPEALCESRSGTPAISDSRIELGPDSSASVNLFVCHDGCEAEFEGIGTARSREMVNGRWIYYAQGSYTYTSKINELHTLACSPGEGLSASPPHYEADEPIPDSGCPAGYFKVNTTPPQCVEAEGHAVLDLDQDNPAPETVVEESGTVTNPDGSTTKTSSKTNPDGSRDLTTTTTQPDGSSKTTTQHFPAPGTNPLDGQGNGDKDGEGGNCVQFGCATESTLGQIRDLLSQGLELEGPEGGLGLDEVTVGDGDDIDTEDLNTGLFEGSPLSGFLDFTAPQHSSQCPTGSFDYDGHTFLVDDHCDFVNQFRAQITSIVMIVWVLIAFFILMSA